ncbi:MAG: FG-GAP-like repeat-containing protein [Isosphaeraceae bacterium]
MMVRRRRIRLLLLVLGAFPLLWLVWADARDRTIRREVERARVEMAAGRNDAARGRLVTLSRQHPGALGGTVDYLLAICEARGGRTDEALARFARLPAGYAFTPEGAHAEAQCLLDRGQIRRAEERLERAIRGGGPDVEPIVPLLIHVYEIQSRFDDVRRLLRRRVEAEVGSKKLARLRDIENLGLGRHPYDGLLAGLEQLSLRAPDEDRVWLGRARIAIAEGRWDEAYGWLRRCVTSNPDAPVWRAWLDWARDAARPDEAARALDHLRDEDLEPGECLAACAWLAGQRGDSEAMREALERRLRDDPNSPEALEQMAGLCRRAGEPAAAAAEFRRRKAEVVRAIARYRSILWSDRPIDSEAERLDLARAAEAAGHRAEARAIYGLILESDPASGPAREGRERLDRADARLAAAAAAVHDRLRSAGGFAPSTATIRTAASSAIVPTFADDAESAGLRFIYENGASPMRQLPEVSGGGVAILDYDGDGWFDVYCVQGGAFPPRADRPPAGDRLFRNAGNGRFVDATESSGIAAMPRGYGHGVTVGDYDGDGDPDLFVTRWRGYALYRNNGDGTFRDVTGPAGLGGDRGWPTSAAMADLDGDGDLDLYVAHYVAWDADHPHRCHDSQTGVSLTCNPREAGADPDRLYRNDGGRFVDVTTEAGIVDPDGRGMGVVAVDLDEDGRIDLFVANDRSGNYLFRNLGGMRFEEVGHLAGVASNAGGGYQAGMGVTAGDLDGDGRIDLAVTNFFGESTTFYRNLGDRLFVDQTLDVGLAGPSRELLGFGVAFLDANDDGWLDLASANGHVNDLRPDYRYQMPAQLFIGGPGGRLTDVSTRAGAPWRVPRMGRGLAVGDLDNDGRVDVLILSHNQPLAYLHNRTELQRSLTLLLEGSGPNRDAIGARVAVVAEGRRQVAWRTGGGSFQSASDPRIHFGLGRAERIESLEVAWPSGRVDRHDGLESNAGYRIREGHARPEPLRGFSSGGRSSPRCGRAVNGGADASRSGGEMGPRPRLLRPVNRPRCHDAVRTGTLPGAPDGRGLAESPNACRPPKGRPVTTGNAGSRCRSNTRVP